LLYVNGDSISPDRGRIGDAFATLTGSMRLNVPYEVVLQGNSVLGVGGTFSTAGNTGALLHASSAR